jgi:hypothetical protein
MLDQLQQAGFEFVGEWTLDGEGIRLDFRPEKDRSSVYIFVLDGAVVYIGKTEACLRQRLNGYRNPGPTQRTNIRLKALLIAALQAHSRIQVLAISPDPIVWNELPLNTAAGLESGLIEMIKPMWNLLNKPKAASAVSR